MSGSQDGAATKARLVEIALARLDEVGAAKLKIRDVADRAGIALSVVYYHFKNKQDLLDGCKKDFYSRLEAVVVQLVPGFVGAEPETGVRNALHELWRFSRANVAVLRLLASEVAATGQLIEPYQNYEQRPFVAAAVSTLAPKLGLTVPVLRLRIQAMAVLVTRFAISQDVELRSVVGADVGSIEDYVVEQLADIAVTLLVVST